AVLVLCYRDQGHGELVKMGGWGRTDGARAWCDGEPALVRCRGGPGGWRWRPAEVASGALMRIRCWAEVAAKCAGLAQEEFERRRPGIYKRTPRGWDEWDLHKEWNLEIGLDI
ncbi:hypothetical protein Taro_021846, partial [Colocasia esculenta]|nr:hypothetical protein [Colocasia esculenta]